MAESLLPSSPSSPPTTNLPYTMASHSQHTDESRHSNEDITVENVPVSNDGNSISKEKYDIEVQSPVIETLGQNSDHGYPDGGLAAWLVVAGVRLFCFLL